MTRLVTTSISISMLHFISVLKGIIKMFEKILNLNVLYKSFLKCKKGVSWKKSIQCYEASLLLNLYNLQRSLKENTYKQKPFFEFDINERGKTRHIKSLHISDRILQRALCDEILFPILRKYFIYDNGASCKGKGISFSRKRLKVHLEKFYREYKDTGYVLLIDFSKFFDNIPHEQLMEKLQKLINDKKVCNLIKELINSFGETSVGIGSQISQIIGIFYPTEIDNYCKIVKGCKYYGRYMDDIYILHKDKNYLLSLLSELEHICNKLGIVINKKKTQIVKLSRGFKYLKSKYIYSQTGKIIEIPDKGLFIREKRKLKKFKKLNELGLKDKKEIIEQYESWLGNLKKIKNHYTVIKKIQDYSEFMYS